jgi:hypothetical protein
MVLLLVRRPVAVWWPIAPVFALPGRRSTVAASSSSNISPTCLETELGLRAALHTNLSSSLAVLAHGHGGTILIVEEGQEPKNLVLHRSYTHPKGTRDILKKVADGDEQAQTGGASRVGMPEGRFQVWREEQRRPHNEAIDFVALLTAVDGATVMTDSLGVLGFGATIRTGDADGIALATSDPLDAGFKPASLSDFPGNRHRSAIVWCASQPTGLALAIVASQDGDVSLFGRTGGPRSVIAIRPFGWRRGLR